MADLRPWDGPDGIASSREFQSLNEDSQDKVRAAWLQRAVGQGVFAGGPGGMRRAPGPTPKEEQPEDTTSAPGELPVLSDKAALLGRVMDRKAPEGPSAVERFGAGLEHGVRASPLARYAGIAPPKGPALPGGASRAGEMIGGLAPGIAAVGAGQLVGVPAAVSAPLVFGGEAGLGEYQREQAAGEPTSPGRIALAGGGTGALVAAAPGVGGVTERLIGRAGAGRLAQMIGRIGTEAGTFGVGGEALQAAQEGRAFSPERAQEATEQGALLFGGLHAVSQVPGVIGRLKIRSGLAQSEPAPAGAGRGGPDADQWTMGDESPRAPAPEQSIAARALPPPTQPPRALPPPPEDVEAEPIDWLAAQRGRQGAPPIRQPGPPPQAALPREPAEAPTAAAEARPALPPPREPQVREAPVNVLPPNTEAVAPPPAGSPDELQAAMSAYRRMLWRTGQLPRMDVSGPVVTPERAAELGVGAEPGPEPGKVVAVPPAAPPEPPAAPQEPEGVPPPIPPEPAPPARPPGPAEEAPPPAAAAKVSPEMAKLRRRGKVLAPEPGGPSLPPSQPKVPLAARAYQDALSEIRDRLTTGANPKGEPMPQGMLDDIRVQGEEFRQRLQKLGVETPELPPRQPVVTEPAAKPVTEPVTAPPPAEPTPEPPPAPVAPAGKQKLAPDVQRLERIVKKYIREPSDDPAVREAQTTMAKLLESRDRAYEAGDANLAARRQKQLGSAMMEVARRQEHADFVKEWEGGKPSKTIKPQRGGEPGERGSISFKPTPKVNYQLKDPDLEKLFTEKPGTQQDWRTRLKNLWPVRASRELFMYEPSIRDDPRLVEAVRRAADIPENARTQAMAELGQAFDALGRKSPEGWRDPHGEYEAFRRVWHSLEFAERADRGQVQPGVKTPDEYRQAAADVLARLPEHSRNAVWETVRRNQAMWNKVRDEEIAAGRLPESVRNREYYTPHILADYADSYADMPGMPKGLSQPSRPWTRQAFGSKRAIDTDYLKVAHDRIARMRMAARIQDFAEKVLSERDVFQKMPQEQRVAAFGDSGEPLFHMQKVTIDGKPYAAYGFKKGYQNMVPSSPAERLAMDPFDRQKFYVVPQNVAERLNRFTEPRSQNMMTQAWGRAFSLWKRTTLDTLGIAYNVNNFMGDMVNAAMESPGTLATAMRIPEIARIVLKHQGDPAFLKFLDDAGVQDMAFVRAEIPGVLAQDPLLRFRGLKEKVLAVGPWHLLERAMDVREQWLHVANALRNWERVKAGKPPENPGSIDIEGLTPEEAVGKIAREITVDYKAQSDQMRRVGLVTGTPFLSWYLDQMQRLPTFILNSAKELAGQRGGFSAGRGLALLGMAAGSLWVWNNSQTSDLEKLLPDYVRGQLFHYNSPQVGPNGERFVYHFQTGPDVLPNFLGVDDFGHLLGQYERGELNGEAFWTRFFNGMTGGKELLKMPEFQFIVSSSILGRALVALSSNRDPYTGKPIAPPGVGPTTRYMLQIGYAMKQAFPVIALYQAARDRMIREAPQPVTRLEQIDKALSEALATVPGAGPYLAKLPYGPLSVARAAGEARIDPQLAAAREKMDDLELADMKRQDAMEEVERAWIDTHSGDGNPADFGSKFREIVTRTGVPIDSTMIENRVRSPRFQAQLRKAQIEEQGAAVTTAQGEDLKRAMARQAMTRMRAEPKATKAIQAREAASAPGRPPNRLGELLQGLR